MELEELYVKENVVRRPALPLGALAAAGSLAALLLGLAALVDEALPAPRAASEPPHLFHADIAHQHLVNLTSIGARVAGSYENEVLGVGVVVEAARRIALGAAPHLRLEVDVQTASGAFPLAFMDGMNHVYHDVQNVVVRLRATGARRAPSPRALLLNCHIDTVPDSPGASDDAAGCAVLLETLRALAASRAPLRHDAIFLFNGAEENVLQASHGFITQHKWAKSVRAFINIEACGAGGREVLFQAGPHDPWIVEVYARAVPHPFASSLAQELFESGLIPADTDFRIFRDFGNLSGVDLAWSANGYVYHTALDTAQRVPRAALQRTGDNVLALAHGLLSSAEMEAQAEQGARQPVFFDVVGVLVVSARAPAALLGAAAALALLAADVQLVARRASAELFVAPGAWWRAVAAGAACCAAACAAGVAAAAGAAAALHALHARLAFYSRPGLLAPLYALPALCGAWSVALALSGRWARLRGAGGWWAARALQQGGAACAAAALCACVMRQLRSGFLPALWVGFPAAAGCLHSTVGGRSSPAWWWAGGALLPALQTWYLALGSWRMFVPIAGRAGDSPLPPDVVMAVLTAALALGACSWLLPLAVAARPPRKLMACLWCACACTCAWVASGGAGAPYAPSSPQRLMVFHTRRTVHRASSASASASEQFYWVPQLDVNTPHSVDMYAEEMRLARRVSEEECAQWLYCGMPYYLPVLGLVRASHVARAPPGAPGPAPRLRHALSAAAVNATHATLHIRITGAAHMVVIVAPGAGARVAWSSAAEAEPLQGPAWRAPPATRRVYFYAVHCARPRNVTLTLLIQRDRGAEAEAEEGAEVVAGTQVSLAAHALFGAESRTEEHERLLRQMPRWVAPTGWGVDLHLHQL